MANKYQKPLDFFPGRYKKFPVSHKTGNFLARDKGFEPLTFWSVARRSIQLS